MSYVDSDISITWVSLLTGLIYTSSRTGRMQTKNTCPRIITNSDEFHEFKYNNYLYIVASLRRCEKWII